MAWDASTLDVASIEEAIRQARALGLTWFDLSEWNWRKEAWTPLGCWATDHAGRFVSIPASEGNE